MSTTQDFAELKWKEKESRFYEMARQAAAQFELRNPELELVGDMEGYIEPGGLLGNVKFKTTTDIHQLLNIYYVFSGDPEPGCFERQYAYSDWSDYLASSGLKVPYRMPDASGNLLSPLIVQLPDKAQVKCVATLWHWIEGSALSDDSSDDIREVGHLSAHLHTLASGWAPPPSFMRTVDDRFLRDRWSNADIPVRDGRVSADDFSVVRQTADRVFDAMNELQRDETAFGATHLDLRTHNCIRTEVDVCPIDFDGSSFSWYVFDLGVTISNLSPANRATTLDAYREIRNLPDNAESTLEAMIIATRLWTWSGWKTSTHTFDWVPTFVRRECEWFLSGEPFLYFHEPTRFKH